MNEYEFEVGKGDVVNGKPEWPDYLAITISRNDALRFISQIALQLDEGDDAIFFPLLGTMKKVPPNAEVSRGALAQAKTNDA